MFRKELTYYFSTPIAYIAIALYLLTVSLLLWVIPGPWNIIDSGYAQADGLMQVAPWLLLILCPALTMRLFAGERQSGTWDVLRVKPVSLTRIVLGKYFAAWIVVFIAQLPCLVHIGVVSMLAEPAGNVDTGAFFGGFLGLILVSLALTAISLWAASLSKSQIVCFLTGIVAGFLLFYGFDMLSTLSQQDAAQMWISWPGLNFHLHSIELGIIDVRDLVYFPSIATLFIAMTVLSLKHK